MSDKEKKGHSEEAGAVNKDGGGEEAHVGKGKGFRLKLGRDLEGVHKAEEAQVTEVANGEIEAQIHKEADFLVFHHRGEPVLIKGNVLSRQLPGLRGGRFVIPQDKVIMMHIVQNPKRKQRLL